MAVLAKRRFDEVEAEENDLVVIDRVEAKKPRMLPFRSSPTSQHKAPLFLRNRNLVLNRPPTLTSASASDSDEDLDLMSPGHPACPSYHLPLVDDDLDMDMTESPQAFYAPVWSPKGQHSLQSALGLSSPLASPLCPRLPSLTISTPPGRGACSNQTPRIPTPIYGHFAPLQTQASAGSNLSVHDAHHIYATSRKASMPPPMAPPARPFNSMMLSEGGASSAAGFGRRGAAAPLRNLPSPICEDDNLYSPMNTIKGHFQELNMDEVPSTPRSAGFPAHWTAEQSQLEQAHMPDIGAAVLGSDRSTTPEPTKQQSRGTPPSVGSRRRSDAIIGEGASKVKLVMGFRADCRDCQERVPGHYSHIIKA